MVIGKAWQWVATVTPAEKISVPASERYTILLMADGKAQAQFDCNRGGGGYTIAEGELSFGPMMSTRMALPAGLIGCLVQARFTARRFLFHSERCAFF